MALPFTEIKLPDRTKELAVVARWFDTYDDSCTQMVGHGLCLREAYWQCVICNQWTCEGHKAEATFQAKDGKYLMCKACSALPKADLERIYALQCQMNRER